MESHKVRAVVLAGASTIRGARVWSNGLGFDTRSSVYSFDESRGVWVVVLRRTGALGSGATPLEARAARRPRAVKGGAR